MPDTVLEAQRDPVTGRFAPRDPKDMAIGQVLEQSRLAREKDAPPEKKVEEKVEKPKKEAAPANQPNNFLHNFIHGEDPPKEDEAEVKAKADAEKAKKEAAAKPKPRVEAPAKPAPVVPAASTEEIIAATAEAVSKAMKPDPKPAPEIPKLSEENEEKLVVLAKMEELYPAKYKGIANKYREAVKQLETYRDEWLKKNPDKEFVEDDPEHEAFMAKSDVDWNDDHFIKAATRVEVEKLLEPERKKAQELEAEILRRERLNAPDTLHAIGAEQTKRAIGLWKHFGDEHEGLVKEDGSIDPAKLDTLSKADRIAFAFRLQAAKDFNLEVAELYKLLPPDGKPLLYFNEKNPVHVALQAIATQMEAKLAAQPRDKQMDANGRQFLPLEDYNKQPEKTRAGRYWTLSRNDILQYRQKTLAQETDALIASKRAELDRLAPLAGYTKVNGAGAQQQPEPKKEAVAAVVPDKKPDSPSGGGESKLAATRANAGNEAGAGGKSFFDSF